MDELGAIRTLLSAVDPPAEAVVRRQKELFMATIDSSEANPRARRRRGATLVAVPLAAGALAAAGWAALHEEATEAAAFACVADGVTAVLPNDGTAPVDACASLWASGAMVAGVDAAPALVACIDDGAVAVIEAAGAEPCPAAGMGTWAEQPAYEALGAALRTARIGLHDRFAATGDGCATVTEWQEALGAQPGAVGAVLDDGAATAADCVDVATIDPTTLTVELVVVPGDHSIGCDPRTGC
jgi:hypothetical protein